MVATIKTFNKIDPDNCNFLYLGTVERVRDSLTYVIKIAFSLYIVIYIF